MIDVIGNDACTASTYASQARHFPNIYIYIYIYIYIHVYISMSIAMGLNIRLSVL
jgi:hypothetical protein